MKKKQLWTAAIAALTLILICGSLYYQDRLAAQNTNLAADGSTARELITEPLTSSDRQYAFLGGTSSEDNQAADVESVPEPDSGQQQQDQADSTYNPGTVSDKTEVSQPVPNPGPSDRVGQENKQTEGNTTVVNNPSRSSSVYNKLSPSKGIYGQFRYRELSGGRIEIDPQWVAQNIVSITLPGLNRTVQVNRAAKDKFIKAFTYIKNGTAVVNGKEVPLLSLIRTMDGTFVPRHANWNPASGLSNHSWGTAIDINASNHFGYVSPSQTNDPNLILWEKAFKPAGFSWGNSYSDSMHFELLN